MNIVLKREGKSFFFIQRYQILQYEAPEDREHVQGFYFYSSLNDLHTIYLRDLFSLVRAKESL